MINTQFDDLRPYYDEEVNPAMCRIADHPLFQYVADFLYPGENTDLMKEKFRNIRTTSDFQCNVMHHAIQFIAKKTITEFSWDGLDRIEKNKAYLYVSNHRDILLDSALMQMILFDAGYKTSEITFGSNLMRPDFVVDIGKSNKMFKVERGGNLRDFYSSSKHLSDYIRYTLMHKNESVWIAQRNGRTKDGNDATDHGIIRMFSMGGDGGFLQNILELNIVPLSISYQYEPCDFMKVRELYVSRRGKYIKGPNEDLNSIIHGIMQPKGKVHLHVGKLLVQDNLLLPGLLDTKRPTAGIAGLINKQICGNYELFDTNYMASDLQSHTTRYLGIEYSQEDLDRFRQYMDNGLSSIEGDYNELAGIFLSMYASPVTNKLNAVKI